jgi:hypothetical protein
MAAVTRAVTIEERIPFVQLLQMLFYNIQKAGAMI